MIYHVLLSSFVLIANVFCNGHINSTNYLPIYLVENKGQLDVSIIYYINGHDKDIYFYNKGIKVIIKNNINNSSQFYCIDFVNPNDNAKLVGKNKERTIFNYFKGDKSNWKVNVPAFTEIVYNNIWSNIDLSIKIINNELKFNYIVNPLGDISNICLRYSEIDKVEINSQGDLVINKGNFGVIDSKPISYQVDSNNTVKYILSEYSILKDANTNCFNLLFKIDKYNKSIKLIIDPALLLFCGYIGGSYHENNGDIAVDKYGNIYIAGYTSSDQNTFPVSNGPDPTFNGGGDAYVAKINASGTDIEYCGYIGGELKDSSHSISVDDNGCVFMAGYTASSELDGFPVIIGPDLTYNGGNQDAFVAKIDSSGTNIEYCGYIGGDNSECKDGISIAVDDDGYAYVTGYTYSDENSFPVLIGPDLTINSICDAFVAKVNNDGKSLLYCGYIGGDDWSAGNCITVDKSGCAYIGGYTICSEDSFPVKIGPDLTFNGYIDAFVAKVDRSGKELLFCGYIGGDEKESCDGIDIDNFNNVYLTGFTHSNETTFPVKIGPDLTLNGVGDAFIAKLNTTNGCSIDYAGYIGGDAGEIGRDIVVDDEGYAYVTGETNSDEQSFPIKDGPDLTYNWGLDIFVVKVDANGTCFDFGGYIGGERNEDQSRIDIDNQKNIVIIGRTDSNENSLPVQIGPDLTFNGKIYWPDAFVTKIIQFGLNCDKYYLSSKGDCINFCIEAGLENRYRKYLMLGALNNVNPGQKLPGGFNCLPFELDPFSYVILTNINTNIFNNFVGELNSCGKAFAKIKTRALPASFIDSTMYFAFILDKPYDFVSNPVPIKIIE